MTLDECREGIGCGVVYQPQDGPPEGGIVTSVGNRYAFVRYTGDQHSKATDPGHLTWLSPTGNPGGET